MRETIKNVVCHIALENAADGLSIFPRRLHIVIVPAMQLTRVEIVAEYVVLSIPPRHRATYWPGTVRAAEHGRKVTPDETNENIQALTMLRTINAIGMVMKGVGK